MVRCKTCILRYLAESPIHLSDLNKIWYKLSLFNAILEGFYFFFKILKFRESYKTNNVRKIILEKRYLAQFSVDFKSLASRI